ncbi:hypothetical protein IE81DRAFT_9804 [Ceraceosorus guamensis]|uniref:Uncharacterized protein n=1 Tax=Ceraceosorus guamensis TaxID=1522189 RepID=A0A316W3Y1_9BASI|nr:hypothetical protein IE81DRAFT_9804 [Ceraceosorus guamensis]PWN44530.1 hypothetical protein IE81DRAFT_9804 [Ceraceosorus guamensis]
MSVSEPQPRPSAESKVRYGSSKGIVERASRPDLATERSQVRDGARDAAPPTRRPQRVDTQALKAKLAAALGSHGAQYWAALLDFFSGRIDRNEFENVARRCLQSEQARGCFICTSQLAASLCCRPHFTG